MFLDKKTIKTYKVAKLIKFRNKPKFAANKNCVPIIFETK